MPHPSQTWLQGARDMLHLLSPECSVPVGSEFALHDITLPPSLQLEKWSHLCSGWATCLISQINMGLNAALPICRTNALQRCQWQAGQAGQSSLAGRYNEVVSTGYGCVMVL